MSDLQKLKIKRLSLAAEARIIRAEEQRMINPVKAFNFVTRHPAGTKGRSIEETMKAKGFSPAQINRALSNYRRASAAVSLRMLNDLQRHKDLRFHRIFKVRRAARVSHLAHAYIKNMPYLEVEAKRKNNELPSTWAFLAEQIAKEVETFGRDEHKNLLPKYRLKDIRDWLGQ